MVPQFADVSQFQGNIDWPVYKEWAKSFDGVSRVAMRSSYGYGYTDQNFEANRAGALAAGIDSILFYHYGYPQYNAGNKEAEWQHIAVGDIREQDLMVLDIEENVGEAIYDWVYAWLQQSHTNYGKLPRVYASTDYILNKLQDNRLAQFPLWLANWQYSPEERPAAPSPWKSYEFLQYTDRGSVSGIAGNVDVDIFLGVETTVNNTPQPAQASTHQVQAANDCWHSVRADAPTGTGIYESWLANLIAGKQFGPPLTHEYNSVDWSGKPIVVQEFAHARCEWEPSAGLLGWYNENGKIA